MTDQPNPPPPGGYPPPPPPNAPGYPPPPPPPPEGPTLPPEAYTPWFTRVVAYLIDNIGVLVLVGLAWGVAFGTGDTVCGQYDYGFGAYCATTPSGMGLTIAVIAWLVSVAFMLWNYGYRQGKTGSSLGKSVMKFKVVSEKTWQPIGFALSIIRWLAHILDAVVCYIGFLWPLWDSKRQTFADKIMSTVCVPLEPRFS